MAYPVLGLHHVTATVDDAQGDLDFCLGALGLRLVKKTVNFDNHSVYHFYYGTERGAPGTIWTTFPYRGWDVPVGAKGAGQVTVTALSVPEGALDLWQARLDELGVPAAKQPARFGRGVLAVEDPSGLGFELVESPDDARSPWAGGALGADMAVRGLHSVTLTVRSAAETVAFMENVLGYRVEAQDGHRSRLGVNGGGAGRAVDVLEAPHAQAARNGLGTVHHVAMAIEDPDDQVRLREELLAMGRQVTEIRDRQYFQSIYFREPGGVLFEVATMAPGFTADEPLEDLGRALKLPPWEEPHRATIEATLPAVSYGVSHA